MDDPAAKLEEYKAQLAQVEANILRDPSSEEWVKLREDLNEVIRLTAELVQVNAAGSGATAPEPAADGAPSSAAVAPPAPPHGGAPEIRSYAVNEKCQAIYEQDGQWYNAKVVALSSDGYFVTFLGFGNTAQVDFAEVRPYRRPDTSEWRNGSECIAVHAADGRWYEGKIIAVRDTTCKLRFNGEADAVEVDLDSVRLSGAGPSEKAAPADESAAKAAPAAGGAAPKIPKNLEIRPDDSQDMVNKKKRKLK